MRKREKLTPEERFALALELVKRERSFEEICLHYQVSHTTAYKIRNAFLDGGRRALAGARGRIDVEVYPAPARGIATDNGSALAPEDANVRDDGTASGLHEHVGDLRDGLAAREPVSGAEPLLGDDALATEYSRR
jgi:transposase-like protein